MPKVIWFGVNGPTPEQRKLLREALGEPDLMIVEELSYHATDPTWVITHVVDVQPKYIVLNISWSLVEYAQIVQELSGRPWLESIIYAQCADPESGIGQRVFSRFVELNPWLHYSRLSRSRKRK